MTVFVRIPALAPFQIRSFRFQWPADLLTSWAFEMEGVILGWFVLVSTGSVTALAVFGSLQFLGTLVSPFFGMAGDRIGNRNVLCLMRITYVCIAFCLMTLFLSGFATPVAIFMVGPSSLTAPSGNCRCFTKRLATLHTALTRRPPVYRIAGESAW